MKQKIVLETIKFHLDNICKVIQSRSSLIKLKVLFQIKYYSELRKINKIKAELIYKKLLSNVRIVIKFFKRKETIHMLKHFIKWRDLSAVLTRVNKYKVEIEQILEKKLEKEVNVIENRIKEKAKEINELRKGLSMQSDMESELTKKMKAYEEKENKFLNTIKKIEEEKKEIMNEIMAVEKVGSEGEDNFKNLQGRIKEYETQISHLQEENKEKDMSISIFLREMGELLQVHEKNSKKIKLNSVIILVDFINSEVDSEDHSKQVSSTKNSSQGQYKGSQNTTSNQSTSRPVYIVNSGSSNGSQMGTNISGGRLSLSLLKKK